jgi:hypothetical protein
MFGSSVSSASSGARSLTADFRAFIDTTYPTRRNDSLYCIGRPSCYDMHERGTAVS